MVTTGTRTVRYVLVNARTGAPVSARLEILRTTGLRLLHLLGRRSLRGGEGVRYLMEGAGDATQRPRAAVDVAFLDREGTVVHALHSLPTSRHLPDRKVHSVIELPAGTLGRLETRAGDVLAVYRTEDA